MPKRKRGPGRPKISPELKRVDVLRVPATRLERRFFEDLAHEQDMPMARWVRDAVYAQAIRELGRSKAKKMVRGYKSEGYADEEIQKVLNALTTARE